MAKPMAQISNGVVTNIIWCADSQSQTEGLMELADRPVAIGDTCTDGRFYRDGAEILTPMEAVMAEIAALRAENADMQAALAVLGVRVDG